MPIEVEQFEQHRGMLFGMAYRMLGSASEAEDVVQDAYVRASHDSSAVQSPRAFLATVVSRLCLDRLKAARHVREQYIGPWLPEPILYDAPRSEPEHSAEHHESVGMAFLLLLERLSPLERIVFLLREVFEYHFDEIASMLGRSSAACRQVYHRAKQHIAEDRPRYRIAPAEQQRLVGSFLAATRDGKVNELMELLAENAIYWGDGGGLVPAALRPVAGAEAIARLMANLAAKITATGAAHFALEWINGELGLLTWIGGKLDTAMIFSCHQDQIAGIRVIRNPHKLGYISRQFHAREARRSNHT